MPTDALLQLQATVTKTDTFQSTSIDLKTGTPRRGLFARIIYSLATAASGTDTVIFSIEASNSSGSGFSTISSGAKDAITLTTTAQSGEIWIPFETSLRYVRLVATFSSAAHTDTCTYGGEISLARP